MNQNYYDTLTNDHLTLMDIIILHLQKPPDLVTDVAVQEKSLVSKHIGVK